MGLPIQPPHLTTHRFRSVRWQIPQHLGDDAATRILAAGRDSELLTEAGFRVRGRPLVQNNRVDPGVGPQLLVEAGFPLVQRVLQAHPRLDGNQTLLPKPLGYERHELGEDLLTDEPTNHCLAVLRNESGAWSPGNSAGPHSTTSRSPVRIRETFGNRAPSAPAARKCRVHHSSRASNHWSSVNPARGAAFPQSRRVSRNELRSGKHPGPFSNSMNVQDRTRRRRRWD